MTPRQQKVLDAIREFRNEHRISPTVRELMKLLDIASPNGVAVHLNRLRVLGKIDWMDGASRSIVVNDDLQTVSVSLSQQTRARLSAVAKKRGITLEKVCQELLSQ